MPTFTNEKAVSLEWNGKLFILTVRSESSQAYDYLYSYDGINWNTRYDLSNSTILVNKNPYNVKWTGTNFAMIGNLKTTRGNTIMKSLDGLNYYTVPTNITGDIYDIESNLEFSNTVTFPKNLTLAAGTGTYPISYSSDNGITWSKSYNSNTVFTGTVNNLTWNGKIWVAMSTAGNTVGGNTIATSIDGNTWIGRGSYIFTTAGQCVNFSRENNMWVAGGSGLNSLAYSYDGIYWVGLGSALFSTTYDVKWNGKIWVAVGQPINTQSEPKTVAYSADGKIWKYVNGNVIITPQSDLTWDGDQWIIVSNIYSYNDYYNTATSNDGINWTSYNTNNFGSYYLGNYNTTELNNLSIFTYSNSPTVMVACGIGSTPIAYSIDGGNVWINSINSSNMFTTANKAVWNGYQWVAGGSYNNTGNTIATSLNGNVWTTANNYAFKSVVNGIAWSPQLGLWVATGFDVSANGNIFAYSTNGNTWTGITSDIFLTGTDVKWNGSIFVATGTPRDVTIGGNTMAYSKNGINWYATKGNTFNITAKQVEWMPSVKKWAAIGLDNSANNIYSNEKNMLISENGINWVNNYASNISGNILLSIYTNPINNSTIINTFTYRDASSSTVTLALGSGISPISYSIDGGNSWVNSYNTGSLFTTATNATWNGTQWVATGNGNGNTIASSLDGNIWVASTNKPFSNSAQAIVWSKSLGYWVATGTDMNGSGIGNVFAYSSNGNTWTGIKSTIFSYGTDVKWNGNIFVATGVPYSFGGNTMAYSTNAINWYPATGNVFSNSGIEVAWSNYLKKWIAIGNDGSNNNMNNTLISTDGISWTRNVGSKIEGNTLINIYNDPSNNAIFINYTNYYDISSTVITKTSLILGSGSIPIYYSTTGNAISQSYNAGSVFTTVNNAVWNGQLWVATGSGIGNTIAVSTDGNIWIPATNKVFSTYATGLTWSSTLRRWVATGLDSSGVGNVFAMSQNGYLWTGYTSDIFYAGTDVAWNGNVFVATGTPTSINIGGNTMAYSYNGTSWFACSGNVFSNSGLKVTPVNNGNSWIAIGNDSSNNNMNNTLISTDGISWTPNVGSSIAGNTLINLYNDTNLSRLIINSSAYFDVSSNNIINTILALGTGSSPISYSIDKGNTWINSYNSGNVFLTANNARWNGRYWIATGTGYGNTIAISTDGNIWNVPTNKVFSTYATGITWSKELNKWVAVGFDSSGSGNVFASSIDGYNWNGYTTNIFSAGTDVAWSGNIFVATGIPYSINTGGNTMAYSFNGETWYPTTGNVFSNSGKKVTPMQPFSTFIQGSGLYFRIVDGYWNANTNYFTTATNRSGLNGASTGYVNSIPSVNSGTNGNVPGNSSWSNYSVEWVGYFLTPANGAGNWTFNISSDDAGYMWIGNNAVSGWSTSNHNNNSKVTLAASTYYPFRIQYGEGGGADNIVISFTPPGQSSRTDGTGYFFNSGTTITQLTTSNTYNIIGNSWIAIGDDSSNNNLNNTLVSINGRVWTRNLGCNIQGNSLLNIYSDTSANKLYINGYKYDDVSYNHVVIASGSGSNPLAYSLDAGNTWVSSYNGAGIFTTANNCAWNGSMWVAVGSGLGNTIATSIDGNKWVGRGNSVCTTAGYGITWSRQLNIWVAVGAGTNSIASSKDGISWTGYGTSIFATGNDVKWNGSIFVAVGAPSSGNYNSIAYSTNGNTWNYGTGALLYGPGSNVTYNSGQKQWIAVSKTDLSNISVSTDGIAWTPSSNSSVYATYTLNEVYSSSSIVLVNYYKSSVYGVIRSTAGGSSNPVTVSYNEGTAFTLTNVYYINSGYYGTSSNLTLLDVTTILRGLVSGTTLSLTGNHNGYFGDPASGIGKIVTINYNSSPADSNRIIPLNLSSSNCSTQVGTNYLVGGNAIVKSTDNGNTWTTTNIVVPNMTTINNLTWNTGNAYVIRPTIYTTKNIISTWTEILPTFTFSTLYPPTTTNNNAIISTGNLYIAAGNLITKSTDYINGNIWSPSISSIANMNYINGLSSTNSSVSILNYYSNTASYSDLKKWTTNSLPISYSTQSTITTPIPVIRPWNSVMYNGTQYILTGGNVFATSGNAIAWYSTTGIGGSSGNITTATNQSWSNSLVSIPSYGLFSASGDTVNWTNNSLPKIYSSTTSSTFILQPWTTIIYSGTQYLLGGNTYIAGGNSSVLGNSITGSGTSSSTENFTVYNGVTAIPAYSASTTTVTFSSDTQTISGATGTYAYANGAYQFRSSSGASNDGAGFGFAYQAFNNGGSGFWKCAYNTNANRYGPNYAQYPYNTSNGTYQGGGSGRYFTTVVSGTSYNGEWIQIELPYKLLVTSYSFGSGSAYASAWAKNFVLAGSNDETTWYIIDSRSLSSQPAVPANYTVSALTPYHYYRIINTLNGGTDGTFIVGYFNLYGNAYIPVTINSSNYISSTTYTYTGADQTVTIPANTTYMTIECWGAGGGTRGGGNSGGIPTGRGGGGGYTKAIMNITSASTLKVIVGQGGQVSTSNGGNVGTSYGGGGSQSVNDGNWRAAAGGGRSAVQLLTGATYNDIVTAGAGGGSGWAFSNNGVYTNGGAGGGLIGGDADYAIYGAGYGGTQSAGGQPGTTTYNVGTAATAGSQYTGGTGSQYGGGGGGGYYGGGGGNSNWNGANISNTMLGGGGGSSYINSSYVALGSTSIITQASAFIVGNDVGLPTSYRGTIGNGGTLLNGQSGAAGQNGLVVITFYSGIYSALTGGNSGAKSITNMNYISNFAWNNNYIYAPRYRLNISSGYDTTTWTTCDLPFSYLNSYTRTVTPFTTTVYTGSKYIVSGNTFIYSTDNGNSWTVPITSSPTTNFVSITNPFGTTNSYTLAMNTSSDIFGNGSWALGAADQTAFGWTINNASGNWVTLCNGTGNNSKINSTAPPNGGYSISLERNSTSNMYISQTINAPAGSYTLTFDVGGASFRNTYPGLKVMVGSTTVVDTTLTAYTWTSVSYSFTLTSTATSISFYNTSMVITNLNISNIVLRYTSTTTSSNTIGSLSSVSYTHLTLPTIYSV